KPDGSIYFVSDGKVRRIRSDGVIESPAAPEVIYSLAVGLDGRLILSGFKLYKEAASGIFQPLRSGFAIMLATDPAGAIYTNALVRISQNCNVAAVTFTQGVISLSLKG